MAKRKGNKRAGGRQLEAIAMLIEDHQVFYPAAREALEESDTVDEAEVEHQVAKDLVEKIRQSRPQEEEYCAIVTVLFEYVNHHIQEEQTELFPQLKKTEIDFDALGEEMQQKKQELRSELGLGEGEERPMEGAMARQPRSHASRARGQSLVRPENRRA